MDNQRINIWERKLLDLTMGNALINTKYGANCIRQWSKMVCRL